MAGNNGDMISEGMIDQRDESSEDAYY